MARVKGRWVPLSLPRRFISDLTFFAHRVPLCTLERTMHLGLLVEARRQIQQPPGWCTLFTKAYALVAARRPELRRAYLPWPWPHLYEHPENVASIAIERQLGTEKAVLFAHLRAPETKSLIDLETSLRRFKEEPIQNNRVYRRILNTSRWPWPLRRLVWWYGLNLCGHRRARHLGTFGISVIANLGSASVHLLTPISTALNYGPLAADGSLNVRLTYDHRMLDGGNGARALAEVEDVLCGELRQEVRDSMELSDQAWKDGPGAVEWEQERVDETAST